jgi:hypothetical protein
MTLKFDSETEEFLDSLKPSTRGIYHAGLMVFQEWYEPQGTITDFFDRIEADNQLPRRQRKRIARSTMKEFVKFLKAKFKPKTVRSYAGSVQSLGRFLDVPISLRYTQLPTSNPASEKYPWTIDEVARFIATFDSSMYQAIGATLVQSGLDIDTVKRFEYDDIQREFEAGITPLCLDTIRWKTDIKHLSFIGDWALSKLKVYFAERGPLNRTDLLFDVSKQAIDGYFRRRAELFLERDFEKKERNPCSPHSCRSGFNTFARDHKADETYVKFFMGKKVPEQDRVYNSKSREGWRQTYVEQILPWVTASARGKAIPKSGS